ncbi:hypothetical protein R3W88_021188 [Solanum pinnatisectum]|uniref:F-box domain-containing protein n=1 Tax=Solanum pinnatisectum TaxID=50273 RepID=A0AAV9LR52_9SOLN|nr:hypothetical protein R3W88_021188 [Solanum pinnatisectum]
MSLILSDDILFSILISLPVKSLLCFQSVSKLWNIIISDNKFNKAYCDQSRALGRLKFLLLYKKCASRSKHVDNIDFIELKYPQVFIEKQLLPQKSSNVICSHDGLILLHEHKAYNTFVLWNPSIRQHKIPCGLCYVSTTDDYKIILIYRSFYLQSLENEKINYSIWSYNEDEGSEDIIEGISTDEVVSERKRIFRFVSKNSIIIHFNVKSDELEDFIGEIELYVLSPLNGCLGLCETDKWELLVKMHWIKSHVKSIKVLYYTKDGEIIFQRAGAQHFFSNYNPRKRAIFITYYRPLPYIRSWYVHRDATCLDSLSFPRLDTHGQD